MPPRANHTFEIGQKLGSLEQAQKDMTTELGNIKKDTSGKLGSLESAVGLLAKEQHECKECCQRQFSDISTRLDDIRNPKISIRSIAHATVKIAGYAGGAGGAFALVYSAAREVLRVWLHTP
jgi:hypothetical protein